MSTEMIVALLGFGGAALGVLAAFLGRRKVEVHRHEIVNIPQPSAAPVGLGLLQKFGLALIAFGVLGGGGWYAYATYFDERRSLDDWDRYRIANAIPGRIEEENSQDLAEPDGPARTAEVWFFYKRYWYQVSGTRTSETDGSYYVVMRFKRTEDAKRYEITKTHPKNPLFRNGGFVLRCAVAQHIKAELAEADRAEMKKVQAVFKAFP